MNKIHALQGSDRIGPRGEGNTHCGMRGWRSDGSSEFSTAIGTIFEVSTREREVTCVRCRQALARARGEEK